MLPCGLFGGNNDAAAVPEIITVEIIITATPVPNQTIASASGASSQVELPSDLASSGNDAAVATIDRARIGAVDAVISTPTADSSGAFLPENCRFHTVISGDTPFGVAERYGANPYLLLEVNNLTVESATNLQIGDRLLVPLEGCSIDGQVIAPDDSSTSTNDGSASSAATAIPVVVEIEVVDVEGLGDITAEGIRLRNAGEQLNVSNWTLSDASGNNYTFPEILLFPDVEIVIFTRSGTSTADTLFWGRDESIWEEGAEFTLSDAEGQIRKVLQIPAVVSLE